MPSVLVRDVIHLGDCAKILPTLPDESVDSIVTDPPYGLGKREPSIDEIIKYLLGSNLDTGGDVLDNDWEIPSVAVWKDCYRILKPGGYLLSFAGTRTFDIMSMGIRAAGFENRDTIAAEFGPAILQWIQAQGFPKNHDPSAAIDKILGFKREDREVPVSEEAKQWDGWGTALKPSWEPILVFRKPISEKTVARQVLKTGTGAMNIDGCRIGSGEVLSGGGGKLWSHYRDDKLEKAAPKVNEGDGRWPLNVVFVHSDGCLKIGTKKVPARTLFRFDDGMKPFGEGAGHSFTTTQMGDADGNEEIPVYKCIESCPVAKLEAQSNDSSGDGIARCYAQFEVDAPFQFTRKANKMEATLRGEIENNHPTKKPLALMRYLVRLVTQPGGVVLDPYCGSGTTCAAAIEEGLHFVGAERDPGHFKTAQLRCNLIQEQKTSHDRQLSSIELLADLPED